MSEGSQHRDDEAPGQDVAQGYPEETQAGSGTGPHTEQRGDDEPDGGADDAPHTSTRTDGDAGQATGNPRAAGS